MKSKFLVPAFVALMAISTGAWAADGGEATIRLMDTAEAELPGAVTKTIALPDRLTLESDDQVAAVEKAKNGHDKANERLENEKRQNGLAQAEAARENGREMAEKATETRENRGRSEDRPEPPGRPDNPGPPDNPGRP